MITVVAAFLAGVVAGVALTLGEGRARRTSSGVVWFDGDGRGRAQELGAGVYLARARGTDEVKVGVTGRTSGKRIGDWESGTSSPVDLEGFVPGAGRRGERRIQGALRAEGWHKHDEWFVVPDDGSWRSVVERAAA
mgnify:FL=1